jgi:hypothetical protein
MVRPSAPGELDTPASLAESGFVLEDAQSEGIHLDGDAAGRRTALRGEDSSFTRLV